MMKRVAVGLVIISILSLLFNFYMAVSADAEIVDKKVMKEELLQVEEDIYFFKDIENYWAKKELYELSYIDIMKGYDDKTMKPDKTISREEFVAMLVRAAGIPISGTYAQYYQDVTAKKWSYPYISAAKKNGLLSIFSGTYFYPGKTITREEMAVITEKALSGIKTTGTGLSFKDIPSNYKYKDSIMKISALGIINGLPDGTFNPKGNATRAQAGAIISRFLKVREPSKEPSDATLSSMVLHYEETVLNNANDGKYQMDDALFQSIGKENALNLKRGEVLKSLNNKGVNYKRSLTDYEATVLEKSKYTAKVEVTYQLKVEADGFSANQYMVTKTVYLKNLGNRWVVYNSEGQFQHIGSISKPQKISMAWQYVGTSTPDMSGTAKIDGLNTVSPTWFTLTDGSGSLKSTASLNYTDWAHQNGYKVWVLVANDFKADMTNKMLNNTQARTKFINNVIEQSKKYKVDGVNIDFENMYTKDKDAFTRFVKELSAKAKQNGLTVSVDVTVIVSHSNWSESYDRAALAEAVDYVALMAYDQYWAGSQVSGSVAQVTWVDEHIAKVLKEVPAHKLLLGVPFYTRLWMEETKPGSTKPVVTSKAISMEEAEKVIADNKAVKTWDEQSGQYVATYKKDNAVYKIWLEDERSIRLKTELVNKYNLAGIASWKLGLEKPAVWNVISSILKTNIAM